MLKNALVVCLLATLLAGCTTVVPTDYAGPDAGKVVLSMGAATGTIYSTYSLLFRKRKTSVSGDKPAVGRFFYYQANVFYRQKNPDYYSTNESGVVLVQSLPPGDYEIYNFDIFYNGGTVQTDFSSEVDFSIPFSVKPGKATYLGNYQANKLTGENIFGMPLPAGAYFVVTDRLKTEWPIAESKNKAPLGNATDVTPEPKRVRNPFFVTTQKVGDSKQGSSPQPDSN